LYGELNTLITFVEIADISSTCYTWNKCKVFDCSGSLGNNALKYGIFLAYKIKNSSAYVNIRQKCSKGVASTLALITMEHHTSFTSFESSDSAMNDFTF